MFPAFAFAHLSGSAEENAQCVRMLNGVKWKGCSSIGTGGGAAPGKTMTAKLRVEEAEREFYQKRNCAVKEEAAAARAKARRRRAAKREAVYGDPGLLWQRLQKCVARRRRTEEKAVAKATEADQDTEEEKEEEEEDEAEEEKKDDEGQAQVKAQEKERKEEQPAATGKRKGRKRQRYAGPAREAPSDAPHGARVLRIRAVRGRPKVWVMDRPQHESEKASGTDTASGTGTRTYVRAKRTTDFSPGHMKAVIARATADFEAKQAEIRRWQYDRDEERRNEARAASAAAAVEAAIRDDQRPEHGGFDIQQHAMGAPQDDSIASVAVVTSGVPGGDADMEAARLEEERKQARSVLASVLNTSVAQLEERSQHHKAKRARFAATSTGHDAPTSGAGLVAANEHTDVVDMSAVDPEERGLARLLFCRGLPRSAAAAAAAAVAAAPQPPPPAAATATTTSETTRPQRTSTSPPEPRPEPAQQQYIPTSTVILPRFVPDPSDVPAPVAFAADDSAGTSTQREQAEQPKHSEQPEQPEPTHVAGGTVVAEDELKSIFKRVTDVPDTAMSGLDAGNETPGLTFNFFGDKQDDGADDVVAAAATTAPALLEADAAADADAVVDSLYGDGRHARDQQTRRGQQDHQPTQQQQLLQQPHVFAGFAWNLTASQQAEIRRLAGQFVRQGTEQQLRQRWLAGRDALVRDYKNKIRSLRRNKPQAPGHL